MKKRAQRRETLGLAKKSVSMPAELLGAAKRAAAADGRSFSNYVARLIAADVRRQSGLPVEEVAS